MDLNEIKTDRQSNPPPYSSDAQVQQPTATVIHAAPGATIVPVVVGQQVGPKPSTITCPSCNHQIVTKVVSKATTRTHLFALLLCLVGCWPCVCIPYCMDSCNNSDHFCPNCNAYIGSYAH